MLSAVVVASVIATVLIWRAPASYARVYLGNVLIDVIDLTITERQELLIKGRLDTTNRVEVENGRVRMSLASCRDQVCVRRGWVSGGLMPIVCLPNRVVVVLDSGDNDIDAVVR